MTETVYRFTSTQDWFSPHVSSWAPLIAQVKTFTSRPRVLEIGSWEGRSAVFLLTELCNDTGGSIVCVDHFDHLKTVAGQERFSRIQHNLRMAGNNNYRVLPQFSFPALVGLLNEETGKKEAGYDWIYVDGSHEADDTLLDGELCWRLAKKGAIVIFDDYHWNVELEDSKHHPKRGIDAFLQLHQGEYTRLSEPSHGQVILRKTVDMRIGFLPDNDHSFSSEEFGYGINLALAVDSSFAIGAAVAIRTAVEHTPGRISIYVADCGLTEGDKSMLRQCLSRSWDVTLSFLPLPETSVARKLGLVWAKLDLLNLLPVERALYLDADILVRDSLTPLWETDLQDKALGAAPDVGYPMGHNAAHKHPYFNAGVLLMDLTKMRGMRVAELLGEGMRMRDAKFRDQDVLNDHFKDWVPLSLRWNAQGLGTYALHPSTDRERLNLEGMNDPALVHFTGPVDPSLTEVLNPHVQPTTAKPWGYIGSPGHPFSREWWNALARTPYAGYETPQDRASKKRETIENKISEAVEEFRHRAHEEP